MGINRISALAVLSALALTACGGGGAGAPSAAPPPGGSGASQQSQSAAVSAINALGEPVSSMTNLNAGSSSAVSLRGVRADNSSGTCSNGIEFFAPDKKGDANSTETQYFFDAGCTSLARDVVRIYAISGTSETVDRTDATYASGNAATPVSTRSSHSVFSNASFDQFGFPAAGSGYDRTSSSSLSLNGTPTIAADEELVVTAAVNNVSTFCGDSAGYNIPGIARLNETFGWQGGTLSGGTRTQHSDGSVTWASTRAGTTFTGPIGGLSIASGSQNLACPISAPGFTLNGGTQSGSYSIPVSTTFSNGLLTNLTVTNATLANGATLNVATSATLPPASASFITGTVSNGGAQVATFAVDAFGDGTLTVSSNNATFAIDGWHVVR